MKRETWGSRMGFIFSVAGSAVGLANIWRFPYIVGAHGGAAFLIVYLLCLAAIGFPVFMSEILIGRTGRSSPSRSFEKLGKTAAWGWMGKLTIITGFIVSSFYSAVAGWVLGYLIEAIRGTITQFQTPEQAVQHYEALLGNPWWGMGSHLGFMLICVGVLYMGVRKGIERGNKWMMPMLFIILFLLVLKGLSLPNAMEGLSFLFSPDWSLLTPTAILIALGQSFFTLSVGQGTMVTYGSYVSENENLLKSCIPVVLVDTLVSILSAVAVFTIVFSVGIEPGSGPGLIFHTLPLVFSTIPGGTLFAVLFFLLVLLAAVTSEISAMEPTIAYLIDEWKWKRSSAVLACGVGAFLLGIPSALSTSILHQYSVLGHTFLDAVQFVASSVLIPLGGFAAVILVGWVWGIHKAVDHLELGTNNLFERQPLWRTYFIFCLKYSAPILLILVCIGAIMGH